MIYLADKEGRIGRVRAYRSEAAVAMEQEHYEPLTAHKPKKCQLVSVSSGRTLTMQPIRPNCLQPSHLKILLNLQVNPEITMFLPIKIIFLAVVPNTCGLISAQA